MKIALFLLIFIQTSFAQELNLEGWSVYSKDPDFNTAELIENGVKPREKVFQEIEMKNKKSFNYQKCAQILEDTVGQTELSAVEKSTLCDRSLNLIDFMFFSIYRKKIDEKKIREFRIRMQNAFP